MLINCVYMRVCHKKKNNFSKYFLSDTFLQHAHLCRICFSTTKTTTTTVGRSRIYYFINSDLIIPMDGRDIFSVLLVYEYDACTRPRIVNSAGSNKNAHTGTIIISIACGVEARQIQTIVSHLFYLDDSRV